MLTVWLARRASAACRARSAAMVASTETEETVGWDRKGVEVGCCA
jgi:hypothetical protein